MEERYVMPASVLHPEISTGVPKHRRARDQSPRQRVSIEGMFVFAGAAFAHLRLLNSERVYAGRLLEALRHRHRAYSVGALFVNVTITGVNQNFGLRGILQDSFNQVPCLPAFAFIGILRSLGLISDHAKAQFERRADQFGVNRFTNVVAGLRRRIAARVESRIGFVKRLCGEVRESAAPQRFQQSESKGAMLWDVMRLVDHYHLYARGGARQRVERV